MSLELTPCEWPLDFNECAAEEAEAIFGRLGPESAQRAKDMAVEFLWNWTGRQFGVCSITLNVCLSGCSTSPAALSWPGTFAGYSATAYRVLGSPVPCCGRSACGCDAGPDMIRLPGPIESVESVKIDGEILPLEDYQIINSMYLQRISADWPTCSEGALEVTYRRGHPVPSGGQVAAGVLALELAKSLCRDSSCRLPQRLQSVVRQGVSVTIMDPFEGLESGKTGLWVVDSWVFSIRGTWAHRSKIYSPDVPRPGQNRVIR